MAASTSGAGKASLGLPDGKPTVCSATPAVKMEKRTYKVRKTKRLGDDVGWEKMSWPRTVAGKIEEGEFKVRTIEHVGKDTEREIEALMRQMEFMEAEMEFEVKLDGYCCDVEDMRKARQEYRAKSLSEAEERSLRQIRDLAASAIADFETRGSPVPDYHGPINVFSDTIPFELPLPLFNALKSSAPSHQK